MPGSGIRWWAKTMCKVFLEMTIWEKALILCLVAIVIVGLTTVLGLTPIS
jgi:hypothetical protein